MGLDWDDIRRRGEDGIGISQDEALAIVALTDPADVDALLTTADAVRLHHKGRYVNTCGISNAKSGRCPEKCNFCSQSAHFSTAAPAYTVKDADTIVDEARAAFDQGVREFSIVMAGKRIDKEPELAVLEQAFQRIRAETGMQTCASLGLMRKEELQRLKDAGMQSFHHNLETARSYHDQIVESHSYDDEVDAIRNAKELGMYVCSGGIFGMGESWAQRVELALDLRALDVDSIPVNFLNPRPGTPLADKHELQPVDCLKIIALIRLVLPTKDVIVCGGREMNLMDEQQNMFKAGANGVMLGNYLTTAGQAVARDHALMESLGMVIRPPPHQPLPPSVPPAVRSEGTDPARLAELGLVDAPAK
ncbi:MAG: biotin synthase BioB [Alphaproteobacteria bacterium]|nr:biotin synthase BioB [Alphaproteobacteria bacterium]